MTMKRVGISILAGLIIGFVAWWVWSFFDGGRWSANRIVNRIENYRQIHGRLPDQDDLGLLQSLGFEIGPVGTFPDYRNYAGSDYMITILVGFDGPYWYYDSRTKTWHHGNPPY
jgi:hypothetical protein